ncbi:MAG: hypothetical protein K9N23_04070 [Akkermansiaceae bacterium]|nr:hypothetical protein [Akkermansiaceae bacterium]
MAHANAAPIITSFKIIGPNIRIVVENVPAADELRIQTSGALNTWPKLNGSTVANNGGGKFTFTAPKPAATKAFYRAISIQLAAGVDPDGDGLPTALENSEGSDFALFDTDDDGFSDGVEFAYGTDPTDPSSKPIFPTAVPTVNFMVGESTATEGAGQHQVPILFDRAYSGTVNYAINAMSNTAAGTDYVPVSGSLTITGGNSAFIPITPIDDANVSGQRVIIIDLKLAGENYFIGGRASHVVSLNDNDAWWTGTLAPASGEISSRIFRVKVAHQGGTTTATFGAGAGNDGLPVPVVTPGGGAPTIGTTSISTSMIPEGSWPATGVVDGAARFHAESPALSIAAGSICNQPLQRQLMLNAQPVLNSATHPHLLEGIRTVGDYTETLTTPTGALLVTQTGSFILVRDIPAPLPVLSPLVP